MEARPVAVGRQTYTGSSEACMLGGVVLSGGDGGLSVLTKVMGLFTLAIGVEYILGRDPHGVPRAQSGSAHGLSPRSAPTRWAQAKPLNATALRPWPGKQESPTAYKPWMAVRLKGIGSRPGRRRAGIGP